MKDPDSERVRCQHAEQWIVVDSRFQLLSIGAALYHGVSPRTGLDVTARHVLLPYMREAIRDGQEFAGSRKYGDQCWTLRVIPVRGPVLGQPLAVLGCYGPAASSFQDPPLVGAWEWRVMPPGPDQQMRAIWSPELFDVYGIERPTDKGSRCWQGPQWIDELIVEADRPEIRSQLDRFLAATTDGLFLHTYRVRAPSTGATHRLRLAGRAYVTEAGPPWWFRGVSARIDHIPAEATPAGANDFINAAFQISADPLCAIDTVYEHLYMTSKGFGDLGVGLPAHRHLPEMVHPEDLHALRRFLEAAAAHGEGQAGPVRLRFADSSNTGWRVLDVVGARVRLSDSDDPHHVLCRVTAARPG